MLQSGKAAKSVLIMIIFALASKLLGFAREVLIAAKFGSGVETDTFFVALTAALLITTLLTQAINSTIIPVLSEIEAREGKQKKVDHTNNLLNMTFLVSSLMVIIGWLLAPTIIRILAHGFEGEQFEFAVIMMRIGLPVIFFAGAVGVLTGYLQSELRFTETAAANFPYNLVYIFFLIFLSNLFGIKGLMVASVLAVGGQLLVLIPGIIKTGYTYRFLLNYKNNIYLRKILYLVPPIIMSVAVNDLNKIVDKSLASSLVEGSISALNYGDRLKSLILGIFIAAIATVIFPMLSREASKANKDGLKQVMGYGIKTILLISIPSTIGMILLAEPIVKIAFERGAFDPVATYMTTGALIFYSLGLVSMALNMFLNKVYYSIQDTKTPMLYGFITVAVNIILNLILVRTMAHRGLALSTSISATVNSGLLLYGLKKKIGPLGTRNYINCGIKSLIASSIMGLLVYNLFNSIQAGSNLTEIIILLLSISLGALVYVILLWIFGVDEITWAVAIGKDKVRSMINYHRSS